MKKVLYRLEIDYLSKEYNNRMLSTSEPIYNLKEGIQKYLKAIKEKCRDDKNVPARCHLWKYGPIINGMHIEGETIAKNY